MPSSEQRRQMQRITVRLSPSRHGGLSPQFAAPGAAMKRDEARPAAETFSRRDRRELVLTRPARGPIMPAMTKTETDRRPSAGRGGGAAPGGALLEDSARIAVREGDSAHGAGGRKAGPAGEADRGGGKVPQSIFVSKAIAADWILASVSPHSFGMPDISVMMRPLETAFLGKFLNSFIARSLFQGTGTGGASVRAIWI